MSLFDFFLNWLVEKYGNDDAFDIIAGAVAGAIAVAVAGVVAGAIAVAVAGVVAGAIGVAFAVAGAIAGAVAGAILYFSLTNFPPLIPFIIACFLLAELFFWTSKRKPTKKESLFWFTAKRKIAYLAEASFWIIEVNGAYFATKAGVDWLGLNPKTANAILNFVGWGTISIISIIAIGFVWIKINELKYKKKMKE